MRPMLTLCLPQVRVSLVCRGAAEMLQASCAATLSHSLPNVEWCSAGSHGWEKLSNSVILCYVSGNVSKRPIWHRLCPKNELKQREGQTSGLCVEECLVTIAARALAAGR